MHVEHSRKHGTFDSRWPAIRHTPAPASLWRPGEERLDWEAFVARFFAGSRRHDFDALAAYEPYRNDVERPVDAHVAEDLPATDDTERWESDGGASPAPAATTSSRAANGRDRPARPPKQSAGGVG